MVLSLSKFLQLKQCSKQLKSLNSDLYTNYKIQTGEVQSKEKGKQKKELRKLSHSEVRRSELPRVYNHHTVFL
jgi:hypothetical protein